MSSENNITLDIGIPQKGRIKVHTQILNDLSSGIYSSPASCVKELINNSYDAEARNVTVRIKPVQNSITIIDDGYGMNAEEFDQKFAWISKSSKRIDGKELSPNLKRPLIGKIGIGFIAVNEICEQLEISSSKKGQALKFTATINFKEYFQNAMQEEIDKENFAGIIKAEYDLINEIEEKDEHYTVIRLLGLKDTVRDILNSKIYYAKKLKTKNKNYDKTFFKSMRDLLDYHYEKNLRSFTDDNEYVKFIIDLASFIPVEYVENGPIEEVYTDKIINKIAADQKSLDFKVDLDGIYLKKPIFFPSKGKKDFGFKSFQSNIEVENTDPKEFIKFKGYFYLQHGILYPRELNGIAIRIKGIPIATQYGFDTSFMQYPNYLNQLFKNWISGEIYIEKGLEDAMNIDRASFRIMHPHYVALQQYLHKLMDEQIFPLVDDIYNRNKRKRGAKKERKSKVIAKKLLTTKNISYLEIKNKEGVEQNIPITIKKHSKENTVIETNSTIVKKIGNKDWEYLKDIFLIFELSYLESNGDAERLREIFYMKVEEWVKLK